MKRTLFVLLAAAIAAPFVLGALATASASPPDALRAAKAASARYHSIEQAEAAGYIRMSPCEASPAGGMGFHYGNPALLADPAIDAERPELLLYAPKQNGELELVGVEYFKVDADQDLGTDADRPSIFGQGFDGPMPGHAPGMPIHYDLHVWLWQDNPDGLFAIWNPSVTCD